MLNKPPNGKKKFSWWSPHDKKQAQHQKLISQTQKFEKRTKETRQVELDMVSNKANNAYLAGKAAEKEGDIERKRVLMELRRQEINRLA